MTRHPDRPAYVRLCSLTFPYPICEGVPDDLIQQAIAEQVVMLTGEGLPRWAGGSDPLVFAQEEEADIFALGVWIQESYAVQFPGFHERAPVAVAIEGQ